jgi:hypothetical protein
MICAMWRRAGAVGAVAMVGGLLLAAEPVTAVASPRTAAVAPRLSPGFHTLTYPQSVDTWPLGITPSGTIIGQAELRSGLRLGFTYAKGMWKSYRYPRSFRSAVVGVTRTGAIVGYFVTKDGVFEGFVETKGAYQAIVAPRASRAKGDGTILTGVNANGTIVGYTLTGYTAKGFRDMSGKFLNVVYGAPRGASTYETEPFGIARSGAIVGFEYGSASAAGFVLRGQAFSLAHAPGQPKGGATELLGIAPTTGAQVGAWWGSSSSSADAHGFRIAAGTYHALSDPLAKKGTTPTGVSDAGKVVGSYLDATSHAFGFIWVP